METKLTLMKKMEGKNPSEMIEYLNLRVGDYTQPIVAYISGCGSVTLFTNEEFRQWYCHDQEVPARVIPQGVYENNLFLERYIKVNFMGLTVPQEELRFGHLGNGVSVWDCLREEYGDYMTVAHISTDRKVRYYNAISEEGRARIEKFAQTDNMNKSVTQPFPVLEPIINK